jgi:hypothetical protein
MGLVLRAAAVLVRQQVVLLLGLRGIIITTIMEGASSRAQACRCECTLSVCLSHLAHMGNGVDRVQCSWLSMLGVVVAGAGRLMAVTLHDMHAPEMLSNQDCSAGSLTPS